MSITLAQLRTRSRERADMKESTFVEDSELNYYINSSIAELHDILVESYGQDYFLNSTTFTTTAGQSEYNISSIITTNDFYKLRGVDAKINAAEWTGLKNFNFNERNKLANSSSIVWNYNGSNVRYRLVGSKLMFAPTPDGSTEIKIWYIPKSTTLVNDSDTFDDINYYAEYVIVDAAIKMLNKEESDVSVLMAQKDELKRRIESSAANRDAGESESIQDVYSENIDIIR